MKTNLQNATSKGQGEDLGEINDEEDENDVKNNTQRTTTTGARRATLVFDQDNKLVLKEATAVMEWWTIANTTMS